MIPGIKKVACGISGGVDSAVAAYLLKRKGYQVTGVFMKNWDAHEETGACRSSQDLDDARTVCEDLGIKLHQASFVKEYWNDVFSHVLEDLERGMTPNPDILCNRHVKFGTFYRFAVHNLGADAIATGHYARTSFGSYLEKFVSRKNVNLLRAVDPESDQTVFLSSICQEALRKTMFPIGHLYKSQVRDIANAGHLKVARKAASTGICFVGQRNFKEFISQYIPDKGGPFIDIDNGKIVAYHKGIHHYTIGQRCKIGGQKTKYFAVSKDPKTQAIYVASARDHHALYNDCVFTSQPYWLSDPVPLPLYCLFRFQHGDRSIPCHVSEYGGGLRIRLAAAMRALTQGQAAVLYKDQICLGSAKILSVCRATEELERGETLRIVCG